MAYTLLTARIMRWCKNKENCGIKYYGKKKEERKNWSLSVIADVGELEEINIVDHVYNVVHQTFVQIPPKMKKNLYPNLPSKKKEKTAKLYLFMSKMV